MLKRSAQLIACLTVACLFAPNGRGMENPTLSLVVGGLKPGEVGRGTEIVLREPDGPRGMYKLGFRRVDDSAAYWQKFYGVRFDVKLPEANEVESTAGILRAPRNTNDLEAPVTGEVRIGGAGWRGHDENDSIRALHKAQAQGCNFIDTARGSGEGRRERIIDQVPGHDLEVWLHLESQKQVMNELRWAARMN